MAEHLGVYPGTVTAVRADGAIKARIPHVLGNAVSQWAPPQVPCGTPNPGDKIYVSFLGGDIRQPIYTSGRHPDVADQINAQVPGLIKGSLKPTLFTVNRVSNVAAANLLACATGNLAVITGTIQVRKGNPLARGAQLLTIPAFPNGKVAVRGANPRTVLVADWNTGSATGHVTSAMYDITRRAVYSDNNALMVEVWYQFGLVIPLQDA